MIGADDEPLIVGDGPPAAKGEAMHRVLELIDLHDPRDIEQTWHRSAPWPASRAMRKSWLRSYVRVSRHRSSSASAPRRRWWAEVPYTTRVADGYATGRIDLVFEEDGELVVVDWKSDAVAPSRVEAAGEARRPRGSHTSGRSRPRPGLSRARGRVGVSARTG